MNMPNNTCRVCKQSYNAEMNHDGACRYHPLLFRGAEAGWYLDVFTKDINYSGTSKLTLREKWEQDDLNTKMESISITKNEDVDMDATMTPQSSGIHDMEATKRALASGHGTVYFWECCGEYDYNAPGCRSAKHKSYDEAK
eukprot:Gregarina_sp_Pseudo_9__1405@NODE_193_length_3680_cov_38_449327_g178_i0_p5_GENE_NODE_193_length_3680_cov_38_449327_g178_i0NODE_193_length_3680_cov_38_449327_g178_i0_p5_ORF_typecomplete_len141_score7_39BTK/PF00779_19/1_4e02BTK/PF00779_19/0_00054CHORD/PF04968_12/0_006CHORD/PF04968_12/1_6e02_NODE_193_length_3680_cov_38_449327_g178_i032383660